MSSFSIFRGRAPPRPFVAGLPRSHGAARRGRRPAQRNDCGPLAFRSLGTNLGGYAVMSEANPTRASRRFAVESVYERPEQELDLLVSRSGLGTLPLLPRATHWGFDWLARDYRGTLPLIRGPRAPRRACPNFSSKPATNRSLPRPRAIFSIARRIRAKSPTLRAQLRRHAGRRETQLRESHRQFFPLQFAARKPRPPLPSALRRKNTRRGAGIRAYLSYIMPGMRERLEVAAAAIFEGARNLAASSRPNRRRVARARFVFFCGLRFAASPKRICASRFRIGRSAAPRRDSRNGSANRLARG